MVVGNDRFRKEIEALTGRRVKKKERQADWVAETWCLILPQLSSKAASFRSTVTDTPLHYRYALRLHPAGPRNNFV